MLAVDANYKLGGDGDKRRQRMRPQRVRAQQYRQAKAGNDGAEIAHVFQAQRTRKQRLRGEARHEGQRHLLRLQAEITRQYADAEQCRQKQNLEDAGVARQ